MVKKFFKDAVYPTDRKSIEHIINGYDQMIKDLFELQKPYANGIYLIIIMSLLMAGFTMTITEINILLRLAYGVPPIVASIYFVSMSITAKNKNTDQKYHYKMEKFKGIVFYNFIYVATLLLEVVLLDVNNKNTYYTLGFCLLALLSLIIVIRVRYKAPKDFITNYLYKDRKIVKPSSIVIGVTVLAVMIANIYKPYRLILILSYCMLLILTACFTYSMFEYKQYDKIQELKIKINYVPKEGKINK